MKKILIVITFSLCIVIISEKSYAQRSGIGLGAVLNNPTGVSYKAWIADDVAVAGAVSFNVGDGTDLFYTQADVVVHGKNLLKDLNGDAGMLTFYYGGGVAFSFFSNPEFEEVDLRVPWGLTYTRSDLPVDAFFEIAPTLQIIEATRFSFNGAIGFRYYFN